VFPLAHEPDGPDDREAREDASHDGAHGPAPSHVQDEPDGAREQEHEQPPPDAMPAADVALTVEMVVAGQLLDIELLDHLIIGQGRSCAVAGRLRGARAECLPGSPFNQGPGICGQS
jgi:hypothetical protein